MGKTFKDRKENARSNRGREERAAYQRMKRQLQEIEEEYLDEEMEKYAEYENEWK